MSAVRNSVCGTFPHCTGPTRMVITYINYQEWSSFPFRSFCTLGDAKHLPLSSTSRRFLTTITKNIIQSVYMRSTSPRLLNLFAAAVLSQDSDFTSHLERETSRCLADVVRFVPLLDALRPFKDSQKHLAKFVSVAVYHANSLLICLQG